MKIVILSLGIYPCPNCHRKSNFYVDYYRGEDGVKLPNGVECGGCGNHFSDEEFEAMQTSNKQVKKNDH